MFAFLTACARAMMLCSGSTRADPSMGVSFTKGSCRCGCRRQVNLNENTFTARCAKRLVREGTTTVMYEGHRVQVAYKKSAFNSAMNQRWRDKATVEDTKRKKEKTNQWKQTHMTAMNETEQQYLATEAGKAAIKKRDHRKTEKKACAVAARAEATAREVAARAGTMTPLLEMEFIFARC